MSEASGTKPGPSVQVLKLSTEEYLALVQATAARTLDVKERGRLAALVETTAAMQRAMQAKWNGETSAAVALTKMQKMLFGASSEKTSVVLGKNVSAKELLEQAEAAPPSNKAKRRRAEKGHGRHGAAAYTGARREKVPHPTLFTGAPCPQDHCDDGKMYRFFEPKTLVRLEGAAPLSACIYELEQWRCHLCLTLVSAPVPSAAGEEKYKASAVANLALMKYCVCMPGSRLEMLQGGYGVPLTASSQWDILKRKTPVARAVHEVLLDLAGNAPFIFNDDTGARILEMTREERAAILGAGADPKRTGAFTTGIVAKDDEHEIALYFTGPRYAGENLAELLKRRSPDLPPPVLMCDGLTSRNLPRGMRLNPESMQCSLAPKFYRRGGKLP